jgi:murein DD-endopeptidase MepM/ murein hydrolase activator NlpD
VDRYLDEKVKKIAAILILVILLAVGALAVLSSGVELRVDPAVPAVGLSTPVKVNVDAPHGLRRFTAALEQNGARYVVYQVISPSHRIIFHHQAPQTITFSAGKMHAPALKDGKARLTIAAESNDFLARAGATAWDVDVITTPPRVAVDSLQHYINQGGCELVTFTASGYWTEAGVRVGKYMFRSFAMPGKSKDERFSLFAYPWDLPANETPVVYVRNPAGVEAKGHFWFKLFPKKFRSRDIELTDAFVNKVVDELDPNGSGDMLSRFLRINGAMRVEDNKQLYDMRNRTAEQFLWHGPFIHLGQEESRFADARDYIYHGKKVDHQVHLGFDLADKAGSPVIAANDGKVVWARPLGIYGNCIVLDHGYGLQSIYGHMSAFGVKEGDMVKKGQSMGKSGATGLAGGDHVHFSMQVDGVQVTPVEWWDEHWIKDRVLSKVGGS